MLLLVLRPCCSYTHRPPGPHPEKDHSIGWYSTSNGHTSASTSLACCFHFIFFYTTTVMGSVPQSLYFHRSDTPSLHPCSPILFSTLILYSVLQPQITPHPTGKIKRYRNVISFINLEVHAKVIGTVPFSRWNKSKASEEVLNGAGFTIWPPPFPLHFMYAYRLKGNYLILLIV